MPTRYHGNHPFLCLLILVLGDLSALISISQSMAHSKPLEPASLSRFFLGSHPSLHCHLGVNGEELPSATKIYPFSLSLSASHLECVRETTSFICYGIIHTYTPYVTDKGNSSIGVSFNPKYRRYAKSPTASGTSSICTPSKSITLINFILQVGKGVPFKSS